MNIKKDVTHLATRLELAPVGESRRCDFCGITSVAPVVELACRAPFKVQICAWCVVRGSGGWAGCGAPGPLERLVTVRSTRHMPLFARVFAAVAPCRVVTSRVVTT